MAFDTMNFKLADRAHNTVRKHVFKGTPLDEAWADVVKSAKPAVGPQVAKAALDLPIAAGLVTCTAEYASLLLRDNAGPAKKVNGLWFGLATLMQSDDMDDTIVTPYISGSVKFSTKNYDWPCGPDWFPDDRWATNEPMTILSRLRLKHKQRHWYIEVCLIEPLHRLYVAHFARACPPHILLGKAKSRGIGCGFDEGDLLTIGAADANGFKPIKTP
ncbi:MAG: hypothetical protein QM783_05500 [Phycisphaerales bacterium]